MQSLVCTSPLHLQWQDVPVPSLRDGHALVKIRRIGICGTDIHAYEGTQPFFHYPRILGHELSGEIVECRGTSDLQAGNFVTVLPYFNCGTCIACRTGKPNCCVNIRVFGVHVDGGMNEYIVIPTEYLIHADGLSLDELALVEPLSIGAHGVARANIQRDEFVLVIGAGPIGLGTMKFAKLAGAKIIGMDVNENRLRFCRETLHIHAAVNPINAIEKVRELTNGDMPTVVIDATGNLNAINSGLQYLAHGGRYVLIGLQKEQFTFSHPEFHKREATLMSSRNATIADFTKVIGCIRDRRVNAKDFITNRFEFGNLTVDFPTLLRENSLTVKAIVEL